MRKVLILTLALALVMGVVVPAFGVQSPTPSAPLPRDPKPGGEREPIVGVLAVLTILIVAVAGLFIYRLIREGI